MSAGTTGVDEVAVAEASRAASRRGGDEDDGAALGSSSSRSRSNRGREGRGEIFSGVWVFGLGFPPWWGVMEGR